MCSKILWRRFKVPCSAGGGAAAGAEATTPSSIGVAMFEGGEEEGVWEEALGGGARRL